MGSCHLQAVQGSDAAGRPIGLIAYLIMGYAATFLAYTWAESMRLGFAIYGIFDFTSTYMYHGWTIKVRTCVREYRQQQCTCAVHSSLSLVSKK